MLAFLKNFKTLGRASVAESETVLRSFSSDIGALDSAVTTMPLSKNRFGFLLVGEESVGLVNKVMREGNLGEVIRINGNNIPFTASEAKAFSELTVATPERSVANVLEEVATNTTQYPQLNITEVNFNSISKSAASDIVKVESNLFKYFKRGAIIALTIGVIIVGVNWVKTATARRKGCFMLTTINGITSSCKVQAYSCAGQDGDFCTGEFKYLNVTLALIKIADLEDTNTLKIKVANAANMKVEDLRDNLSKAIDNSYNALYTLIISEQKNLPPINVCAERNKTIEGGVIPACRLCSPTANPLSTQYIDPALYGDNITFQCVENPSILNTITDAAISTGKNLLDGIGTGLKTVVKPLIYVLLVIVVLMVVIFVLSRLIRNQSSANKNQSTIIRSYTTPYQR